MLSAPDFPLLCPVCRNSLRSGGDGARTLVCGAGHSFDAAKQGYFNFLVGKGTAFEADTAQMVAARFDFLSAGHYQPLADAVAELAAPALAGVREGRPAVLDAGTGTGHYLRTLLDRFQIQTVLNQAVLIQTGLRATATGWGMSVRALCRRPSVWTFPSSLSEGPPD